MATTEIVKNIIKATVKNPKFWKYTAGAIGVPLSAYGISKMSAANTMDHYSDMIQQRAIEKLRKSEMEIEAVFDSLRAYQIATASMFEDFSNSIEKIQQKPEGLFETVDFLGIPKYNLQEFKVLSNNARLILDSLFGVGLGAGLGASLSAAIGSRIPIAGFSFIGLSTVLFVEGKARIKKANERYENAEKVRKEIDAIVSMYSMLSEQIGFLIRDFKIITSLYEIHIEMMRRIVESENNWEFYSNTDRILIQNTILLACVLNAMCTIDLVKKSETGNDVVDFDAFERLSESSEDINLLINSFRYGDSIAAMENIAAFTL